MLRRVGAMHAYHIFLGSFLPLPPSCINIQNKRLSRVHWVTYDIISCSSVCVELIAVNCIPSPECKIEGGTSSMLAEDSSEKLWFFPPRKFTVLELRGRDGSSDCRVAGWYGLSFAFGEYLEG